MPTLASSYSSRVRTLVTGNAAAAVNALGGSKDGTAGADGVADVVDLSLLWSEPVSYFLSPPQPASRIRAAVTAVVATIGRNIVGFSPRSTENDRLNASSVHGSARKLSTGIASTCNT